MIMIYEHIIAIDPDVEKNGVAHLIKQEKKLAATVLNFVETVEYLKLIKETFVDKEQKVIVVVEAGWLNQGNYHLGFRDSTRLAAAKGVSVGRNQQVGHDIVDMARHIGFEVQELRPLKKCWKGKDGKITHDELKEITGIAAKRSNQEERDAALIAWVFAGLPIWIKPQSRIVKTVIRASKSTKK